MTTYPIADPLRGKTVPDDGAFATDDQVMTGADPRAGVKGGVASLSSTAGPNGYAYTISGEFSAIFIVKGTFTGVASGTLLSTNDNRRIYLTRDTSTWQIRYEQDTHNNWIIDTGRTVSEPFVGIVSVLRSASGVFSVSVNGSAPTAFPANILSESAPVDTSDVVRLLGSQYNGYPSFGNIAQQAQFYNRALTADEIKACNKGEVPAELARQALSGCNSVAATNGHANWSVWDTTFTAATATDLTVSGTGGNRVATWTFPVKYKLGQKLRIRANASGVVGDVNFALQTAAGTFNPFSSASGVNYAPITNSATYEAILTPDFVADDITVFGKTGGSPGTQGCVLTGIAVEVIGTVEHFAADQVTSTGRWIGKFGTSLIPDSGITPLNPQPVQPRKTHWIVDQSTPSVVYNGGSASGWGTPSLPSTGVTSITKPAWLSADSIVRVSATRGAAVGFTDGTRDAANIYASSYNVSGVAANDSFFQIEVTHIE